MLRVAIAALGLAVAVPVAAVWTEPELSYPSGPGSVPVRTSGTFTKQGSLDFLDTVSITGPDAASAGSRTSALFGQGQRTASGVSAGLLGQASSSGPPACTGNYIDCPLHVGVFGGSGASATASNAVYGDSGGQPDAWAGYFFGNTFFLGPLTLAGASSLISTGGVSVGYPLTSPIPLSIYGTVQGDNPNTGKSGIRGTLYGANASGSGIAGVLSSAFDGLTCPSDGSSAGCSGVVGSLTSATGLVAGRWAGFFNGNVRITGSLYVNGVPFGTSAAPASNQLGFLQAIPSGSRLGYTEVTGGTYDGKGGIVSDGQYLAVTKTPIVKGLTRYLGGPISVYDQPINNKTIGRMTYDGQYYWANLDASPGGLWRFDGQSFASTSPNFATGYTGTDAQPYFDGTNVLLGLINSGNLYLGKLIVATSATSQISLGAAGCTAPQFLASDGSNYYVAVPPACGDTSTTRVIKLNASLTVTGTFNPGAYGVASGIVYDGTNLWVVATLPTTVNVVQFKTDGTFVRAVDLGAVSSASGFTGGPIVFDGANLWAAASKFAAPAEGKLYRIDPKTGTATFIDRTASGGTPYPKHPIWNLYFDGQYLWLTGYNSTASPRVNWYLEKRKL